MNQNQKPNVIVILADDMGYSDIGCYGGHIDTPHLDRLASNGIRFTEFSNTARCSPSRASLLTGLHPHQAGMAHLQGKYGPYTERLSDHCVTIAEVLKGSGYGTYHSGKWHAGVVPAHQRGFDQSIVYTPEYFNPEKVALNGQKLDPDSFDDDFFSTDHMTDQAVGFLSKHREQMPNQPYFLYLAFNAPHFPLQAKEKDIQKYKGRFDQGWDVLRDEKFGRMQDMNIIDASWELSPQAASAASPWAEEPHKAWRLRAFEVYAAMVDCMDQNIGRLLQSLEEVDELDNTLIMFLSDNGGSGEFPEIQNPDFLPGGPDYLTGNGHYGYGWANLSNTPFRMYKHYIHEGGIASPFIVHWPAGLEDKGDLRRSPAQLTDIMATIVEVTCSVYPKAYNGNQIIPMEGTSMVSIWKNDTSMKEYLFWEHEGNCGVRHKNWKLVRFYAQPWELYDMVSDGTEVNDLAEQYPEVVRRLEEEYVRWTQRANVLTREQYLKFDKNAGKKEQVVDIRKLKESYPKK
ncbi:arylsulfatase [Paenibacillus sp. Soil724D2]|uniref:arylsulfatase n=1 Tax=Paenibacillus sp. (strain Soil724D2) TaxID=1736392 RepID=UPI000714802A|nr:arylsulfatase [Paenibacillus sp. Soil724D2]KRE36395.1 hypothetical protein ASG85_09470 [Paenibacillus sp. Soil724D2]